MSDSGFQIPVRIDTHQAEGELRRLAQAVKSLFNEIRTEASVGTAKTPGTFTDTKKATQAEGAVAVRARTLAEDPDYVATKAEAINATKDLATRTRQAAIAATTSEDVSRQASLAVDQKALKDAVRLQAAAGTTEAVNEQAAARALAEKRNVLQQQITYLRELLGLQAEEIAANRTTASLDIEAQVLQRQYNTQRQKEVRAAEQAGTYGVGGAPPGGNATLFQRFYARIRGLQGQADYTAEQAPNLGQFFGGKFLTTAGFALSGAALYGAVAGIRNMINQATELEKVLNQVRAQFESMGDAAEFAGFRSAILDISKNTGEMAKDVAFVGFQMKGAFQDTQEAIEQTTAAIKITRVTGLSLSETVDSLTATAKTYGVSIEEIGDRALGIQERFGVLASQSIKAVADLAPVAKEVGLSLQQTYAILGVAQQYSGRAGSAIAEGFGRILPALQEHRFELAQIYAQNPKLAASYNSIIQAIGQGNMGQVLDRLIRDWGDLDKIQQDEIITMLGGRREAQTLVAVLSNSGRYVEEMSRKQTDAGKTTKYFSDLQKTLSQQMAELKARFIEFGEALFKLGLGAFLKDFVSSLSALFDLLGQAGKVFGAINNVTGGFAGRLLFLTLAVSGLNKVLQTTIALRVRGALVGLASGIASGASGGAAAAGGLRSVGGAIAGGVSGLAAGLGVSTTTLGIGAVVAAGFTYKSIADRAVAGAKELHQKFRNQEKYSDQKLKELADDDQSFWGDLHNLFFGSESHASVARAEQRRRAALDEYNKFHALRQVGLFTQGGVPGALTGTDLLKAVGLPSSGIIPRRASQAQQRLYNQVTDVLGLSPESIAGGGPVDPKLIEKLDQAVDKGVKGASQLMEKLLAFYRKGTRVTLLQDALKRANQLSTRADQISYIQSGEAVQTAQSLQQAFQSGDISSGGYVSGLQTVLKPYVQTNSLKSPVAIAIQKQLNEFYSSTAKAAADMQNQLTQLTGAPDVTAQSVARLTALLRSGQLTPKDRLSVAQEIIGMLDALKEERLRTAGSVEAELNILEHGIQIPKEARVAIIEEQIRNLNPILSQFILAWAHGNETLAASLAEQIAQAVANGKSAYDAVLSVLELQAKALQTQIDQVVQYANQLFAAGADVGGDIQRLQHDLDEINGKIAEARGQQVAFNAGIGAPTTTGGGQDDKEKARQIEDARRQAAAALRQAQEAQRQAQLGKDNAGIRDPVLLAQAQKALADAQAAAARKLLDDARAQIAAAATIADPVQRDAAETAARTAEVNAITAILNAQTAQINADKGLQDAFHAANQSKLDLARAVAESLQDVVGAAQIDVQKAVDQLNYDVAHGAGDAQINQDRATLVTAQANAAQTARQNTESIIDFNLQAHRITTDQAIAQLTAILVTLDQGTQEYRDLFLRIQALKEETNKDLQFDVPTSLDLSGLFYQSRRLLEAQATGGRYQDNRQQSVVVHAYNAADYQEVIEQSMDMFSGRSRLGIAGRRY